MKGTLCLGGKHYATKKAAAEACRQVLHGTPPNEDLEGDDKALIEDVLRMHPHAAEKIGAGIKSIYVVQRVPSKCFFVRRMDDTEVDFSYQKCLTGARS